MVGRPGEWWRKRKKEIQLLLEMKKTFRASESSSIYLHNHFGQQASGPVISRMQLNNYIFAGHLFMELS